ncbi:MAG: hypothetical protein JNK64_15460 [Myxococcales bacterium]|nr:hypothetical protein [Myxococcales bacterium]
MKASRTPFSSEPDGGPRSPSRWVAPAAGTARVEDDPFGLHLPATETRFIDDDGAPPSDAALDNVAELADELERLIERAEWPKLRPDARAEFAPAAAAGAQARRNGDAPDLSSTPHMRRKYRAYRAIPYERDAHEVGAGGALAFEAQP